MSMRTLCDGSVADTGQSRGLGGQPARQGLGFILASVRLEYLANMGTPRLPGLGQHYGIIYIK